MSTYYFWDIENISFHNFERIMDHVRLEKDDVQCYVVFAKIKEAHKEVLKTHGWQLFMTEEISRNSADMKIKDMIEILIENDQTDVRKIVLITEDKGFKKTGKKIIEKGYDVEIICATKNPTWVNELAAYKKDLFGVDKFI